MLVQPLHSRASKSYATHKTHKSVSIGSLITSNKRRDAKERCQAVDMPAVQTAFEGGSLLAVGLSVFVMASDPEQRRTAQTAEAGGDEMEAVKKYFTTEGFDRWKKIYGETDEVSKVQLDIRKGHAQTVEKVLAWVDADGNTQGTTFCDAGCGTGSLTVPLALRGGIVSASDISPTMVEEAKQRFAVAASSSTTPAPEPTFEAVGLEEVSGQYDTVCCLDVLIHYPSERADSMVAHLAGLSKDRLILSFAPKTPWLALLKRIGELAPGPSKATRAYLHTEEEIQAALKKVGFEVTRKEMTSTQFYFSRLFEARRATSTAAANA